MDVAVHHLPYVQACDSQMDFVSSSPHDVQAGSQGFPRSASQERRAARDDEDGGYVPYTARDGVLSIFLDQNRTSVRHRHLIPVSESSAATDLTSFVAAAKGAMQSVCSA